MVSLGLEVMMKECALGERDVYIEGLLDSEGPLAVSTAQRAANPERRVRGPSGVSKAINGGN